MGMRIWGALLCLWLTSTQVVAAEKVVVLTSYPQEVVTQFERGFEQTYPQYRVEILWRQSRDAMTYLHQQHAPVDVYWTPAQRNFMQLAEEGRFKPLPPAMGDLPKTIGGFEISDRERRYVATEVAGFGMAYNPDALSRHGLQTPRDWKDLTAPFYQGQVVFPIPSKVGYAPMLVDTLLEGYGWTQGWDVLRQIAANATLADAGSTFISDDVGEGRAAVGATIDFFAVSAIANGKPIRFTYPEKVGYSPAHLAIFTESANPTGAEAFAKFVLSAQGQKLLFHPDIRKLPVSPEVYREKPEGYFDPYQAAEKANYPYDIQNSLNRQELVAALFDALITRHHAVLVQLWDKIHLAEKTSPNDARVGKAKALANWVPVTVDEANQAALQASFKRGKGPTTQEVDWSAAAAEHYRQALVLAEEVIAQP